LPPNTNFDPQLTVFGVQGTPLQPPMKIIYVLDDGERNEITTLVNIGVARHGAALGYVPPEFTKAVQTMAAFIFLSS
jgi:hypothetical protein